MSTPPRGLARRAAVAQDQRYSVLDFLRRPRSACHLDATPAAFSVSLAQLRKELSCLLRHPPSLTFLQHPFRRYLRPRASLQL